MNAQQVQLSVEDRFQSRAMVVGLNHVKNVKFLNVKKKRKEKTKKENETGKQAKQNDQAEKKLYKRENEEKTDIQQTNRYAHKNRRYSETKRCNDFFLLLLFCFLVYLFDKIPTVIAVFEGLWCFCIAHPFEQGFSLIKQYYERKQDEKKKP